MSELSDMASRIILKGERAKIQKAIHEIKLSLVLMPNNLKQGTRENIDGLQDLIKEINEVLGEEG